MELVYNNKKTREEILNTSCNYQFLGSWQKENNLLIKGENFASLLLLLKDYSLKEKVDLIYIDPPFSTGNTFGIGDDRCSTMSKSFSDKIAYRDDLSKEAFLEFLRERLILAYELLSKHGSIYVHIDYKIGHYVKILMDEIFGIANFRNDITRIKCNPKNFKRKAYGNIKDLILFYTKSSDYVWNDIKMPFSSEDVSKLYRKMDKNGRSYTTVPLHAPGEVQNGKTKNTFNGISPPVGRHWRCGVEELEKLDESGLIEWSRNGIPRKIIYADEQMGKKVQDVWEYKDGQTPSYPTEKNLKMLEYIVQNSSYENSLVLDFFAGSATTLLASSFLGRKWIGIDESEQAIRVAKMRLQRKDLFLGEKQVDYLILEKL
ncbi:MAG: site-specific DNA-methyltransferase [Treponema sp.]